MNITIYNEFLHEQNNDTVKEIYPDGIHAVLKDYFKEDNVNIATLENHRATLSDEVLNNTDVLIWWGHLAHDKVDDGIVDKIHNRVYAQPLVF